MNAQFMKHRDYIVFKKLIDEVKMAQDLIGDMSMESFCADERTKRAVSMTVVNIGELVKTLTDEIRAQHKDVAWKEAAGFRDVSAHKYMTLDMGDVYKTIKEDFPVFLEKLNKIYTEASDE